MVKRFLLLVIVIASGCASLDEKEVKTPEAASERKSAPLPSSEAVSSSRFKPACPNSNARLINVEVLDGPREEKALLRGEESRNEDRFDLRYVYDAGRYVSVRCLYSDGKTVDLIFRDRIDECRYKIESDIVATFECQ